MRCFARWKTSDKYGLIFRDQTILQFGDSWNLLASIVLHNPGSAEPIKGSATYDDYLQSNNLPFYVSDNCSSYYKFKTDPLMKYLHRLYLQKNAGGVLKLYNLFNLKNQDSSDALKQFRAHRNHPDMFTAPEDIRFGEAPVVIATGSNVAKDNELGEELKTYISLADKDRLFSLSKVDSRLFAITSVSPDKEGMINSYHPSFTFKYGNKTVWQ